jgi:hypothetical protein
MVTPAVIEPKDQPNNVSVAWSAILKPEMLSSLGLSERPHRFGALLADESQRFCKIQGIDSLPHCGHRALARSSVDFVSSSA